MESISRLREALILALSNPEHHYDEQELFDELMINKQRLFKLLDVGPRSQTEQREIESGKTTIDGRHVALNSDFVRQVLFLAQQLDCSERYLASLLQNVMDENPNIDSVSCIELTTARFHQVRRHLVDCLRYLLEATTAAERKDAPPTYARIATFVKTQLLKPVHAQTTESLASRILKEIENIDNVIIKAEIARKNAGSDTIVPSGQALPTFGYDVLNARYDSLHYERRYLATSLTLISRLAYLSSYEIRLIIDWLSTNPNHPMTSYFLTSALLAFDPADPLSDIASMRHSLAVDSSLVTFMTKKLSTATEWKELGLKSTVLLKWTMFLTEARHSDTSLELRSGFKTEELETQVWNAVQGDAFAYLYHVVSMLPVDGRDLFLFALETLVRSLITHASSELRKIKQRQEDLILAHARDRTRLPSSRFAASLALDSDRTGSALRHDISQLYSFIGLLYSTLPPEKALQFWGSEPQTEPSHLSYMEYVEISAGKLPAFLQWAVWSTSVQDLEMLTGLYNMLTGLAKGQQCSELAYNFLARGGGEGLSSSQAGPSVSWSVIFSLLENWAINASNPTKTQNISQSLGMHAPLSNSMNQPSPHLPSHQFSIGQKDVLLAQAFLRLLSTVVTHSIAVRITVSGHAHFRAIPTLVSLIPLGIPLELKGAIFDTLAAFCIPGAGIPGVEICKAVWSLMERLEVINVRISNTSGVNSTLATGKGVEIELEQVESTHRLYPATIPFLRLLSTLIHTSKRIPLSQVADMEPVNTIPESLGQPYRLPGIGPFSSFVIDNVFANIPSREYSQLSDRWQINDLCLCFIERCLASFELESLVASLEDTPLRNDKFIPLLIHPGYDIMKRLLTNSPLQASILSYIVEGVEGFERNFADEEPFFRNTIIRVLRIVHRVLEIQDIFLDVLVPILTEFDSASVVGTVHSRSYFTRFDQALSFGPQYIPALAAYVAYQSHPEVVLLSVKIITILSMTKSATMVTLIQRSSDSERILSGFVRILGIESNEDVSQAEEFAEQSSGAGAPETDEGSGLLEQAIRIAALDLLIQDTDVSRPYPNLAHYLLFGSISNDHQIQDPHALGARQRSIHILLDLINSGIPRLKAKRKSHERPNVRLTPLFASLPALAERCYCIIYQLCVHPRTSDFTTRYFRTREDFFARQLATIPSLIPELFQEPYIQVLYGDGSRVTTTIATLSSFLRLRSYIFDLVALELHVLTHKGHFKGVTELLDILFGADIGYQEQNGFEVFHEVGQSHMRIVDFLQSLLFDWSDSLTVEPMDLVFFNQLNVQACIRKDSAGCDIVDRTALLSFLATGKRALHSQGAIVTASHVEQLNKEINYILESCAIENHRRKVVHSLTNGFESWRRLLDMALTKCFDRLPHDRRENMLFDLLHVLPPAIRSPNVEESTAVLLSETILSSITKLREDRRHQVILQSIGGDAEAGSLPAERLHSILRNILEGILDNNHVELVRGNLYASLINFIHLVAPPHDKEKLTDNNLSLSLSSSMLQDSLSMSSNQSLISLRQSTPTPHSVTSLEAGCLSVMKPIMERLIATISRDAIDGTEVWKTIAFMLLDALVQLSDFDKQHPIHAGLNRHGILSNFVRSIKDSDGRLQSVLKPDPDDINPLYVYEAKMSLFIRMSQSRVGAERLLESQVIPILAQCDFIDARPEADQSFMDQDSFLPSAIQRYHQLFMPALQTIDGMLAVLGNKHTTVINQTLDFLSSHGPTIVILLKNDSDEATLALLEEIHLLVVLCTTVLPRVPKSELLSSNSGFGSIHAALLSLSAKCLGRSQCFRRIIPQTDAEMQMLQIYEFGYESRSKFDMAVRRLDYLLRKSIVSYLGAASEFTEPEITLVLSPMVVTMRRDDEAHRFSATVPTIGDALEALEDICSGVTEAVKQISDLGAELANKNHIGLENAQEILRDMHPSLLQDLDTDQKRSLICQELERIQRQIRGRAKILLGTIEMLLLLLWRHLEYYTEPRHMNIPPAKTTLTNAMRILATSDPKAFQNDVSIKLSPSLQRLSSLELDPETFGRDWQANQGYIEIMCRKLKESVGLRDESSSDGQE